MRMSEDEMAIVKSLVSVAWADGTFEDTEKEMVAALVEAFDATEEQAKEVLEYASEKRTLDDMPILDLNDGQRRTLLQHAVLLTYVDGSQHEAEKSFIGDMCKRLGIGDDEAKELVDAAEARAKRFLKLL